MSGIDIIGALLRADQEITAIVPPERIVGLRSEGNRYPALILKSVSATERRPLSPEATRRVTERVQVTIAAQKHKDLRALLILIRHACRDQSGEIGGGIGVSLLLDGTGPEFVGEQPLTFFRSQDFRVTYLETA